MHTHDMADQHLARALATLDASDLRNTAPRRAILKFLTASHGPFSAEEVHAGIDAALCDLVTVYRCLAALEEIGLLRRCDLGDGCQRYEYNSPGHHHHHLVCRKCRRVSSLDLCVVEPLERLAREQGYTQISHVLEIFGLCPECQSPQSE